MPWQPGAGSFGVLGPPPPPLHGDPPFIDTQQDGIQNIGNYTSLFWGPAQFMNAAIFASGQPWVDVIAYGADPTQAQDSTSAIQAAINAAAGTVPVFIPAGKYLITSTLTCPYKQQRIFGAGMGITTLRSTAAANPVLSFSLGSGSGDTLYSLEDLTLNGGSASNGATAISLQVGATGGDFKNVEIINYALGVTNGTNAAFSNCFRRCFIHANTVGVSISLGSQQTSFRDCQVISNTQNNFLIGDASHQCPGPILISGCNIQAANVAVTVSNVLVKNCDNLIVEGCYSETNTTTASMDIEIGASTVLTPRVTVRNCRFLSNGANSSVVIDSGTTGAILLLEGNRQFNYAGTVIVDSGTTSNVRRICNTENSTFINDSFNGTVLVYP